MEEHTSEHLTHFKKKFTNYCKIVAIRPQKREKRSHFEQRVVSGIILSRVKSICAMLYLQWISSVGKVFRCEGTRFESLIKGRGKTREERRLFKVTRFLNYKSGTPMLQPEIFFLFNKETNVFYLEAEYYFYSVA